MKNTTILHLLRERSGVPGMLTAGVLALSQTLFVPSIFAGTNTNIAATTNESKASQISANKTKLNAIKTQSYQLPPTRAKNVILFVGDGMGVSTITAARILEGQNNSLKGTLDGTTTYNAGENNLLSFEEFPYSALSRTYSVNQQVSDSAPTMTAMVTGVKTNDGFLGVSADVVRGNDHTDAQKLTTIAEQAKAKGLSVGVVTTARVTHATPAGCYAHVSERNWECDSNFTTSNNVASGRTPTTKDIAAQLIDCNGGKSLDVVLGGGRYYFMKNTQNDPEYTYLFGKRTAAGRDLISEWKKLPNRAWNLSTGSANSTSFADNPRSAYVWNKAQFDAVKANPAGYDRLLGLFEPSHVQYEADRANDAAGEPSLADMATTAVDFLSKNRNGYFLMVEGGRIDHAHHAGNAYRALTDTIAFSDAIRAVAAKVSPDTLIVVTADHSHTFTIAGYPVRGNPILGLVTEPSIVKGTSSNSYINTATTTQMTDLLGLPYTTLGYANGPGYTGAATQYTYTVANGTISNGTVTGGSLVTGSTLVAQGSRSVFVNMQVPTDSGGISTYASAISGITSSGTATLARPLLTLAITSNLNYAQESTYPLQSETHGGEDVGIFAKGPNAHLFRGSLEQSMIYWIMADALRLNN
jgi:alkaline phosphatase